MSMMMVDQPHTWTAFRPGTIPCEACGVAIHECRAEGVEPLAVTVGMFPGEAIIGNERQMLPHMIDLPVGRCEVCQQIHDAAVDLMTAHSTVRRAIGDAGLAVYRTELALYALDALGVTRPAVIDSLTGWNGALTKLIDAMAGPGMLAMWSTTARARPWADALKQPASASRWEHVNAGAKRALSEAWVGLYVSKHAKPVPVGATDEDGRPIGCMLCGVGTVMALASEAEQAWVEMMTDPETIGAPSAPEPVEGVLCPRCDHAIDRARGIGPSAMRISVLDLLGADYGPRWDDLAPDFRVIGWAALPSGTTPNAGPWDHVNLEPLRDEIARSGVPLHGDYQPLIPIQMPADAIAKANAARRA